MIVSDPSSPRAPSGRKWAINDHPGARRPDHADSRPAGRDVHDRPAVGSAAARRQRDRLDVHLNGKRILIVSTTRRCRRSCSASRATGCTALTVARADEAASISATGSISCRGLQSGRRRLARAPGTGRGPRHRRRPRFIFITAVPSASSDKALARRARHSLQALHRSSVPRRRARHRELIRAR